MAKAEKKNKAGTSKSTQKKIIIGSVAITAAGILGYFGWKYFQKKKEEKDEQSNRKAPEYIPPPPVYTNPPPPAPKVIYIKEKPEQQTKPKKKASGNKMDNYTPQQPSTEFPLKPGSRGEKVRQLQDALITKHGRQIFPKYGADGQWGTEMSRGLAKLKLPLSISESVFNVLVQGEDGKTNSLADKLKEAAEKKDYQKAISFLQQIRNTEGYTAVNDEFKKLRINGGVRQTLVNGMLNSFTKPEEKEGIRMQFLRMGLQYDGSKWSLSGLDGLPLVTTMPARVWLNKHQSVDVPARMLLGNEIMRRGDFILFENRGKYFLIHKNSVSYL